MATGSGGYQSSAQKVVMNGTPSRHSGMRRPRRFFGIHESER